MVLEDRGRAWVAVLVPPVEPEWLIEPELGSARQGGAGGCSTAARGGDAVFVGVDISKARFDVAVRPTGELFAQPNSPAGITEMVQHLQGLGPTLVVVEATGGLE